MKRPVLLFLLSAVCVTVLWAAPPAWWSDPQTRILDPANPSSPEDNYTPANLGQLKHTATQAKKHLDAHLPGGSGVATTEMVNGFAPQAGVPYTSEEWETIIATNYAPVNLGQLKTVAKPFYDRLLTIGYDTKANLIANGYPSTWAYDYPWNPATPVSENYAPANLGQLKMVFSFDLAAPAGQLPAWWLNHYFPGQTGIGSATDPDGDGLTNLQEYQQGSTPNDYYSQGGITITPRIEIVSGNNQLGEPDTFARHSLTVKVSSNGLPLVNAPVTFAAGSGGMQLALDTGLSASMQSTLTLRTDNAGLISNTQEKIYYRHPGTQGATGQIEATTGTESVPFSFLARRMAPIGAGYSQGLALKSNGTVWSWGNYDGTSELGPDNTSASALPVQISGLNGVEMIAAGPFHSIAVKNDGTVWTWGTNDVGQLGNGTTNDSSSPVSVSGVGDVLVAVGGSLHSLALKSDGTVWAWGSNWAGELGDNSGVDHSANPVEVSSLQDVRAVSAGEFSSFALKDDGTVWAWGANWYGELGINSYDDTPVPVQVLNLGNVESLSAGQYHALAVKNDGTVWAWGNNGNGQLGNNSTVESLLPLQVPGLDGVTMVAAGETYSLAVKNDGTVWFWGERGSFSSLVPVPVSNVQGAMAVAAGHNFSMALKADGTIWMWGDNSSGQLGDGRIHFEEVPPQKALINLSQEPDDANGDGISDSWAILHFGTATINLYGDADSDGLNNMQEYLQGSEPTNYYSQGGMTIVPVLTLMGGNHQAGLPGKYLSRLLSVEVRRSDTGALLIHAPVVYSVTSGAGGVSKFFGDTTVSSVSVKTGANGECNAYYKQSNSPAVASTVTVTAGTATAVNFTATTTLVDGAWSHWKFNEGVGTAAAEDTGLGVAGTLLNAAEWTGGFDGKGGLSLSGPQALGGSDACVTMGNPAEESLDLGADSFSIALWVKYTNVTLPAGSSFARLVSKGHKGWDSGYLLAVDGTGRFAAGLGSTQTGVSTAALLFGTTAAFNDGKWHHLAAVFDRQNAVAHIYVDGEAQSLQKQPDTGGVIDANTPSVLNFASLPDLNASRTGNVFTVGSYAGTEEFFNGGVDDVRIYRKALDIGEITALYHSDSDANGLPDFWEWENFGQLGVDPSGDPDEDAISNLEEFQTHKDPHQADPLAALAQAITVEEDTLAAIPLPFVGGGSGGPVVSLVSTAQQGTVELDGTTASYYPNAHYNGNDSFRFRVAKGGQSSEADVSITVTPVNDPPLVNAGGGQGITLPASANLGATVTDIDTDLQQVTLQWMKVSGPGDVTFGTPGALATTAAFSAPGGYLLRLSASDGGSTRSDSLIVEVNGEGASNLPTVSLQQPAASASYEYPASIAIAAQAAADSGVSVTKVEFYEGSRKIGEATAPNGTTGLYEMTWQPPRLGAYSLGASVTDSAGRRSFSTPVTTRVTENGWFADLSSGPGNEGFAGSGGNGGASSGSSTGPGGSMGSGGANGGGNTAGGGGNGLDGPVGSDSGLDSDGDGLSDAEELAMGTNPLPGGADTDKDGVPDGLDGWPLTKGISPPRMPDVQYAVIDLASLGFPATHWAMGLDDHGGILGGYHMGDDHAWNDAQIIYFDLKDLVVRAIPGTPHCIDDAYIGAGGHVAWWGYNVNDEFQPVGDDNILGRWHKDTGTLPLTSVNYTHPATLSMEWHGVSIRHVTPQGGVIGSFSFDATLNETLFPNSDTHRHNSGGVTGYWAPNQGGQGSHFAGNLVKSGSYDQQHWTGGPDQSFAVLGANDNGMLVGWNYPPFPTIPQIRQLDGSVVFSGNEDEHFLAITGGQDHPPTVFGYRDNPMEKRFWAEGEGPWTAQPLIAFDPLIRSLTANWNYFPGRDSAGGPSSPVNNRFELIVSYGGKPSILRNGQIRPLPDVPYFPHYASVNNSGIILFALGHSDDKSAHIFLPFDFTELNPESGFDRYTEPHWLMVPKDQQNWAKAITPANAGMEIKFKGSPASSGTTVSPDSTHQSSETLTVSSPTLGDTTSITIGIGTAFGTEGLKLSVKKYKPMTVTLHVVTQQDGGGAPHALCIGPGANGVINTSPGGDDTVGGGGIRTGGNGLCETTAQGDDVQILRPAIKVTQVPSASEVQQMLTTVYGLQVNTYFTVTLDEKIADYDLDRNGLLDINVAAARSNEQDVLENHVKSGTDFNLYYVHNYVTHGVAKDSLGFTIRDLNCAYIKDGGPEEYRVQTAAHEIGHIFGLAHPDVNRIIHPGLEPAHGNDKDRLMRGEYNSQNLKPSLLLKFEWDVINRNP